MQAAQQRDHRGITREASRLKLCCAGYRAFGVHRSYGIDHHGLMGHQAWNYVDLVQMHFGPSARNGDENGPKLEFETGEKFRERPPGLIQHILTVLVFFCSGCCSYFGLHLSLGASHCAPGLAFCFMGHWTFAWICYLQLPCHPYKNGDAQHMFLQDRGAHTEKSPKKWIKWPEIPF